MPCLSRGRLAAVVRLPWVASVLLIAPVLLFALVSLCAPQAARAQAPAESHARCFLIGNSLTWDTVPGQLSGPVQWHVDCGVNLQHIQAHPEKPCVASSTLWPTALQEQEYDLISVQPHYGSTWQQDVQTISAWMKLQPRATFVLHSGWARQVQQAAEFGSYTPPAQMVHSPTYMRTVLTELRRLHPERAWRQTMAQNLLAAVAEDIAQRRAPFQSLSELYRDEIHLTHGPGRYLMHNAMRRALGQPHASAGFPPIEPDVKAYLDSLLAWLDTSADDRARLSRIVALDAVDRSAQISQVENPRLRGHLESLLPELERAAQVRRQTLRLEAEVQAVGGRLYTMPAGPQWLYLAAADAGLELFDVPATIDLYNGNNPLKGQGGRNEQVNDAWLARLTNLPTLRRLDLSNCAIQGDGLRHVAGLAGLRELNLTLTPVTDDALGYLAPLQDMRMLGLASTQCRGTGFAHLAGWRQLESVNFHFTPLDDAGLAAICQVPISDRFWFAHAHFTDAGAAALARQTQLKRCGIGSKEKTSSGEAVAALVKLPLEELSLLDNQATGRGLYFAAQIATLRRLDLSHAPTVADDSMPLVAQLPKLEEFVLGSAQVTDEGLLRLAESKSLKKLSLRGLKRVTPEGLERLRMARPELTVDAR